MSTLTATKQSPFALRLLAYSNERFPAWQVLGQFPMFLVAFLFGQVITGKTAGFTVDLFVGFAAFVAYTLMVRTIDDHKDAAHDNAHYPERVLQRGLVTFTHLKIIGVISLLVVLGGTFYVDRGFGPVSLWLLGIFVSNNLVQFVQVKWAWIGEWLEARRVLLALSVIPFWGVGAVWAAQMGAGAQWVPAKVWWLVALWSVAALLLEIARKSRTPEDTRETVVDYTKSASSWTRSLGLTGTVVVLAGLALGVTVLEFATLAVIDRGAGWAYAALGVTALLPVAAALLFWRKPTRVGAKNVSEASASVWLIGQIVFAVAILTTG
ncbi:hypothetical protein AB0L82_09185 [Nocardia sp. NPDC052001]|uniref:hypothetical protein n=1 Tax=Nocardia sp. NPDC052001 TaxID=3154853 RepID=UPI0034400E73